MEHNIKIVRLQSGEDIIAAYYNDMENDMVILDKPMHVIFKRIPTGKTVMMMLPWLPIELIKENSAIIDASDILTIVEPRDELVDYYINAAVQSDELLGDTEIGNSLKEGVEEIEEDMLAEALEEENTEEVKAAAKKLYH